MNRRTIAGVALLFLVAPLVLGPAHQANAQGNKFEKINHVIVLYLENHTVDNLYSSLPGVNGIHSPGAAIPRWTRRAGPTPPCHRSW
jgi:phospholipase C